MTIAVADVAPSSPVDTMAEADAVAEGAADGTAVGILASSTDAGGGSVIYSLLDDAGGRFAIDPSTGVVTVADGDLLDYESAQSHTIMVAATTGGLSATSAFTIAVTDVGPATINGTDGVDIVDATHTPLGQELPTSEADKIYGYEGDDQLSGLAGNDLIDGGLGADLMYGGSGNDTFVVNSAGDITVEELDGGTDTVQSSTSYALAASIENLTLIGTASRGTGNSLDNAIIGNGGNNVLAGLGGADRLDGGASGTDTADYSASDAAVCVSLTKGRGYGGHAQGDTLVGIDNITGSDYNDTLEGGAGTNILRGGAGNDTVTYERAGKAVTVTLATTEQQDTGGAGRDRLYNIENLTGTEFDDQLTGTNGANVLRGLGGNDRINGGGGNDALDGGIGADILTGGAGIDSFIFGDLTGGVDTIADFVSQSDLLKIVSANFGGNLVAGAAAILFTTDDAANAIGSDEGGYFIFDNAGEEAGTLYFDATGGTGEDATAFAQLLGTTSLVSSDFLIV
jgi:Ca2+-binding RTX toxin-like protein